MKGETAYFLYPLPLTFRRLEIRDREGVHFSFSW